MAQKVLVITTLGSHLRAEAQGWNCDNPDFLEPGQIWLTHDKIGLCRSDWDGHCYATVLQALAAGWKLLGPPQDIIQYLTDDSDLRKQAMAKGGYFAWWLVKD